MQVFSPSANAIARAVIVLFALLVIAIIAIWYALPRSAYATRQGIAREQPIQFSHVHHVEGLGIDCRYCHWPVEVGPFAGVPATSVCMNCHSQIWWDSPMLEPVRESYFTGQPIHWTRVHDVPDFVYFHHAIHLDKGVGCTTCHGRVDLMPLVRKDRSLLMEWCLECHFEPERYLRPREAVFDMAYVPPADQLRLGRLLADEYEVRDLGMADCYTCHR